jgi:hypothetical protein
VLTRSIVAFSREGAGVVVEPTAAVQLCCSDVFGNAGGDGIPASVIDLGGICRRIRCSAARWRHGM